MKKTTTAVLSTLVALGLGSSVLATMEVQKEYKKVDAAAKCETCHVAKLPKKGAADRNDFGKKIEATKGKDGKFTAEAMKAVK